MLLNNTTRIIPAPSWSLSLQVSDFLEHSLDGNFYLDSHPWGTLPVSGGCKFFFSSIYEFRLLQTRRGYLLRASQDNLSASAFNLGEKELSGQALGDGTIVNSHIPWRKAQCQQRGTQLQATHMPCLAFLFPYFLLFNTPLDSSKLQNIVATKELGSAQCHRASQK